MNHNKKTESNKMKMMTLETKIGQVTLERGYDENYYDVKGSFKQNDRTVTFKLSLHVQKDGTINRNGLTCGAIRKVGGVEIGSTVQKMTSNFIMLHVCPEVSKIIKENHRKWYLESVIEKMEAKAKRLDKDAIEYREHAQEVRAMRDRVIRTRKLPQKNLYRYM